MNKDQIDWTSFRKRITINKPLEEVYSAWACQENMETWFLEKAWYFDSDGTARKANELVQDGDDFIWKWNNWDFDEKGRILAANGIDLIAFTFGSGGTVHLSFKNINGSTELTLVQEGIPTDEKSKMNYYVGCSTGWTFWLANLKAWLEFRITLHATGLSQEQTADLVNS